MIQPEVKIDRKERRIKTEKIVIGFIFLVLVFAVVILFFTSKSIFFPVKIVSEETSRENEQRLTRMSLTPFDVKLAKEFMDKNGDGKCDVCGMDVQVCIDSGQMQCNMDSKSTIGVLDSQHIHSDWKVYINGKALDDTFFKPLAEAHENAMKDLSIKTTSSFIHIHEAPENPLERVGDVLHMHATGVPLWIFFKSAGMDFSKDCLTLSDDQNFCNNGKNTLKFYVNGQPNSEWENYILKDLDKILISYGEESNLSNQLNSITDFAKNH